MHPLVAHRTHSGKCLFLIGSALGMTITFFLYTVSSNMTSPFYYSSSDKKMRLACLVITMQEYHKEKDAAVKETWGKHCHILLFFSDVQDDSLPSVAIDTTSGSPFLWGKVKKSFMYTYKHLLDDADWFLKADDDTYVVVENLEYLLRGYDHRIPHYIGGWYDLENIKGYMTGGAGYVLSSGALQVFAERHADVCRPGDEGIEDVEVGKCMAALNISFRDTRDEKGLPTFLQYDPEFSLDPQPLPETHWFLSLPHFKVSRGADCCSERAIGFHDLSPNKMRMIHYFLYTLKIQ